MGWLADIVLRSSSSSIIWAAHVKKWWRGLLSVGWHACHLVKWQSSRKDRHSTRYLMIDGHPAKWLSRGGVLKELVSISEWIVFVPGPTLCLLPQGLCPLCKNEWCFTFLRGLYEGGDWSNAQKSFIYFNRVLIMKGSGRKRFGVWVVCFWKQPRFLA
jgi:hypothetical protein